MRYCTNCNRSIGDNDKFCHGCGQNTQTGTEIQPKQEYIPHENLYPEKNYNSVDTLEPASIHFLETIKNSQILSLTKAGFIIFFITLGLGIISSFFPDELYYADYQMDYFDDALIIIFSIIGSIPALIIGIGLWKTYKTCAENSYPHYNTSGLSMIKGTYIFILVIMLIASLIGLISIIFITISEEVEAMFLIPVLLITIGGIVTFGVFICLSVFKIINNLKLIFITDPSNPVSVKFGLFIPVILFISAGFSAIAGLILIIESPLLSIVNLLSAASYIILPIAYLKFKNEYLRYIQASLSAKYKER